MDRSTQAAGARPGTFRCAAEAADQCADALMASDAMIRSLHLAIGSAAHPDCPACRALLPVLAAYLAPESISSPA